MMIFDLCDDILEIIEGEVSTIKTNRILDELFREMTRELNITHQPELSYMKWEHTNGTFPFHINITHQPELSYMKWEHTNGTLDPMRDEFRFITRHHQPEKWEHTNGTLDPPLKWLRENAIGGDFTFGAARHGNLLCPPPKVLKNYHLKEVKWFKNHKRIINNRSFRKNHIIHQPGRTNCTQRFQSY